MKKTISLILTLVMLVTMLPVPAHAAQTDENPYAGKVISILGDSISTYTNYSNGTAAENTNSTIANGAVYYPRSGFDVTAESTWWYQAARELGMEILVNNSWSGSCLLNTRSGTVGAYVDRCVQLHDNTGDDAGRKPDIIAIFLGTNDYYTYPGTLGSYETIDFDALIREGENGFVYAEPTTSLEAYAISLHKIGQAYPDAQVYCFTLLPRVNSTNQPTAFNEDICQLAEYFGVNTVDLYNCGIPGDSNGFYMLMGDSLHPDNPGMDAITNAFVSAMLKNSELTTYDVSFRLEGAVAMEGTTRTVISGGAFQTTLAALDASLPLEVTVTMGGADITESCLAGNVVTIPSVTGEVVVTAKPGQRDPMNFRWETQEDTLVSVTGNGNTENALTMTHGTITDGVFSRTRFTMRQGISLRHDLPWCVEWKSSGTWTDTTDGALLFSEAASSSTADACYFYRRHNNDFFAFGSCTGGKYHNYGVKFAGTGIDTTAEHVFRLENRIAADGSNMVWLLVDGEDVGPLNHHYIGGTDQKETVDWVSGKDFTFSYMGTNPHTIGGCSLEYVQVWEAGAPEATRELTNFRWEYDAQTDSFVNVTHSGNRENPLTMTHGTITDGTFAKTRFTLTDTVMLNHDSPWSLEWKASGAWTDTTDGALLFAEANASTTENCAYLYRRHKNTWFALGIYENGKYHNYAADIAGTGIDTTEEHVYRLTNRIADDGSNMVYLYIDGVEIGPMNHHYIGGTDQNETVDWVSGKDFRFSYMGTTPHTIGGGTLDYVQVWEKGIPCSHSYTAEVTPPTCTEQGYTTYTCECGDSYVADHVEALGHTTVIDAGIKENSARPGVTEGSHCDTCGEVLEAQQEIPAKGYDWMLEDGEFKILLIGNSFSQDASSCGFGMTESQLYNMLQAMLGDDVKVTLGLLYSGGKGVHWYATQTERGTKAPSFYTITPEKTVWTSRGGTSTETAITWTDWDVVTLQPYDVNFAKEQEGVPEKYKAETDEKFYPLETATEYMLDFIGTHAPQADVYCYMHWARSSATVASLNAAFSTYQKFAAFYPKTLDYLGTETGNRYTSIIPVGLSIQNARTTYLATLSYNIGAAVDLQNDPQIGLQRDGGHVTYNVGRYIAGLTFAEMLIPQEMRAEGYVLPGIRVTESVGKLPEEYTEAAQKSVFAAVESWREGSLEVTNLEEYAQDPAVSAREELESMTLNLTCGDDNALIAQIREKVLGELSAEFVVEAVAVDVEKNTAVITLRFGYTSVEAEMAYTLTDHNYENGTCTRCGAAAPSAYAGKTIACIGDSITYGVGVTKDRTDYVTLLAKSLEMDYIRLGASGTTLCTDGHATCNIRKLTEANLAGADVVTILMGINDFVQAKNGYYSLGTIDSTDTSTIYGAVHMWCRRIEELRQTDSLKDTEFYFMTPVITSWNNSVSSARNWDQSKVNIHGYTLRDLCNAVIAVCALYDIPVIDLNLVSGLYYNSPEDNSIAQFGGDGAHPGEVGHQMMAEAIENVLLKNNLRDDHDHSYGSWITTTYPDCESGEQQRVCAVCAATERKMLDGKGHAFEDGICTVCGAAQPGPRITCQPEDFVGMVGETATFTVAAEGEDLQYQWYYYDAAASRWGKASNGNDAGLNVEFKAYRNNRQYRCVITDARGNTLVTETVRLIAQPMDLVLISQPVSYVGAVNDEVTFAVEASGNGITYQWYYSSDGGENWYKSGSPGCGSNAVKPILRAYRDGNQYKCVISDVFGNTITSSAASIAIQASEVNIIRQPVSVTHAVLGKLYTFSVAAEGDNLTYCWEVSTDGGDTWTESWCQGHSTDTLTVRMNANRSGNRYRCVVTSGQKIIVVTDAAVLTLQAPSAEIVTQPRNVSVVSGAAATFSVEAAGTDLVYQWYRSDDKGATWTMTYLPGHDTDTLSFTANASRAARFMCKITDGSGKIIWTVPVKLQLLSAELQILNQPESVVCANGETAVFTVEARGDKIKYDWHVSHDGGATWTRSYLTGHLTSEFSFVVNAGRAARLYKCVITDSAGNVVESDVVSVTIG